MSGYGTITFNIYLIIFLFKETKNRNFCNYNQTSSHALNNSLRLNGVSIPLHIDLNPNLANDGKHDELVKNLKSEISRLDQSPAVVHKEETSIEVPTLEIIRILNQFVFYLFLIYIVSLNLFGLWIFPYYVKEPLTLKA